MYILGCSIPTCDQPVCANLGLKTLKNRRDFCKLKCNLKVMCMNDERLRSKGLSALGIGCASNPPSIRIDRVRTANLKNQTALNAH